MPGRASSWWVVGHIPIGNFQLLFVAARRRFAAAVLPPTVVRVPRASRPRVDRRRFRRRPSSSSAGGGLKVVDRSKAELAGRPQRLVALAGSVQEGVPRASAGGREMLCCRLLDSSLSSLPLSFGADFFPAGPLSGRTRAAAAAAAYTPSLAVIVIAVGFPAVTCTDPVWKVDVVIVLPPPSFSESRTSFQTTISFSALARPDGRSSPCASRLAF